MKDDANKTPHPVNRVNNKSRLTTIIGCSIALAGALIVSKITESLINSFYKKFESDYQPLNNNQILNYNTNKYP